jgi:hypothetical protein
VPFGEGFFDLRLEWQQGVHGVVEIVFVDLAEFELDAEAGVGGGRVQTARAGEGKFILSVRSE